MTRITAPGSYAFTIPVEGGKPIQGVRVVGNSSGKTLVVTAGVHGDEYVGIQAVRELLSQLSPQELSGQVLFVPVVNTSGFFSGTYRVPEDGENLNRCFPGAKGHTYTWNMAAALEAVLCQGWTVQLGGPTGDPRHFGGAGKRWNLEQGRSGSLQGKYPPAAELSGYPSLWPPEKSASGGGGRTL